MAMYPLSEILKLSVAERLQLVEDIWDSIAENPEALTLTPEQADELDRRLAEAGVDPGRGRTWEEVRAHLLRGE